MPEDNSHSLVPKPSGELSASSGAERILSEMTSDALKIHQGGLTKTLEPGTLIWEFETGGSVASSPAIGSDGTVYVGSDDNKLYAINGQSGVKLWEFDAGSRVFSSPAIGSDGTVYIGSVDNKLYAINGKSGDKLWEFEMGGYVWDSPAIGSDGTVYVGSDDNKLYAINGKSGVKLWEFETGGELHSSPAIGSDGTVYVGSDKFYALNIKTGAKKWEFETNGDVYSTTTIGADGTVYFMDEIIEHEEVEGAIWSWADNGFVYALDGRKGIQQWVFEIKSAPSGGLAIGLDDIIYILSMDGIVTALEGKTGKKRGEYISARNEYEFLLGPVIGDDGTLYIGSDYLQVIDVENWMLKWEYFGGPYISPTIGDNGILYCGGGSKVLAIATSSKGPPQSPWPMFGQNPQHTGRAPQN